MLTCKEAEKLVMPFINWQLGEEEMEEFLNHIRTCPACKEELETYYTVFVGLKQLDLGTGGYNIPAELQESLDNAWTAVRTVRVRKVLTYAVNTLWISAVLIILLMQLRIWIQNGIF